MRLVFCYLLLHGDAFGDWSELLDGRWRIYYIVFTKGYFNMRKRIFLLITIFSAVFAAGAVEFHAPRMFGVKVGYLDKMFRGHHNDGGWTNMNCWGIEGHDSGLHFGITVEPYFGKGVSLSTGVYYEYFRCYNRLTRWRAHEHLLYVPAHVKFSYPLSRKCAIYVLAGPAVNWGLNIKLTHGNDPDLTPHFDTAGWPRRMQLLAEGGLGFQWDKVAVEIIYGAGMLKEDSMPQGLYSSVRQQKLTVQLEVKFW